jgi:hypothetical protein
LRHDDVSLVAIISDAGAARIRCRRRHTDGEQEFYARTVDPRQVVPDRKGTMP